MYWFRAFRRESPVDVLAVLKAGDLPNPDPDSISRQNEAELGFPSACVYAYLGQTLEAFSSCGVVAIESALSGTISPFDTGGLVNHIEPIRNWPSTERRAFLVEYSWEHTQLARLMSEYPGKEPVWAANYLFGRRPPAHSGLHDLINTLSTAALWQSNDDWRAWIWEGRCDGPFPALDALYKWTCPPDTFASLVDLAATTNDDSFIGLIDKYVRGGVSELVESLRAEQLEQWLAS